MRIRVLVAALLFGTVLLVGVPGPFEVRLAHACSCADPAANIGALAAASDAVFVGTVEEIRRPEVMVSSTDESRFVFAVRSVHKGDDVHARQSVVTASDGASCGLELSVGDTALVFGRAGGDGEVSPDDGEYTSSLCEVVRGPAAATLAEQVGAAVPPQPGSSPIGVDDGIASTAARNWFWIVGALAGAVVLLLVWWSRRRRAD